MKIIPEIDVLQNIEVPAHLGAFQRNVPLAEHTTIQIGGPAEIFASPADTETLKAWIAWARSIDIPHWILGGGANILVSDKGFPGIVLSTRNLNHCRIDSRLNDGTCVVELGAGTEVSAACNWACENGLAGLDFLYAMPGTIGGAVWMNARCYGSEIAAILESVQYLDPEHGLKEYHFRETDWAYKHSPFQAASMVLLSARFRLHAGDPQAIRQRMQQFRSDRTEKGHFRFPSAGSTFKNNYDYGKPTGIIIDELHLRGRKIGGAQIAPYHGNIFINTGNATATDMRRLITEVQEIARNTLGIDLEPEVLYVGDWTGYED
ncbi:MAG: UDP-N-acetylmuramate dehydrogenase [Spirochaeta sp.]